MSFICFKGGLNKMYLKDINNKSWKVNPRLKITENRSPSISNYEQECHINILKSGYNDENKKEIHVVSSYLEYMTKLSKSEYFTLNEVVVSINSLNKGQILEVTGVLADKGITIRKRIPTVTEEEKIIRSKRMKLMRAKQLGR